MTPATDVVVVSYNSRDTLRACVEPLAGLDGISVIVVDNASPDRSLEAIADLPVRAIASEDNRGFGAGCNLGLAAGTAPFVLFLNPDAYISEGALQRLADVLVSEPEVGIAGPRTIAADGVLVPSMRRYQRAGSVWATALFAHRFIKRAAWANEIVKSSDMYEHAADAEWLSGGCLLVRHEGGRSAPRTALFAVLARSRMRFARRHAGPVSAVFQRLGLATGALTHLLANATRPAHRRGHIAALLAIVGNVRR